MIGHRFALVLLLAGCDPLPQMKPTIADELCAPYGGVASIGGYTESTWHGKVRSHQFLDCKDGSTVARWIERKL